MLGNKQFYFFSPSGATQKTCVIVTIWYAAGVYPWEMVHAGVKMAVLAETVQMYSLDQYKYTGWISTNILAGSVQIKPKVAFT